VLRFPGAAAPEPEEPASGGGAVVDPALLSAAQAAVLELMRRPVNPLTFESMTGEASPESQRELRTAVAKAVANSGQVSESQRPAVIEAIIHEMRGYGPLEPLLKSRHLYEEIVVSGPNQVRVVHRGGKSELTPIKFRSEEHVRFIAQRLLSPARRRVTEADPLVDAALPGMRLNVVAAPIAVDGCAITIRFHHQGLTAQDLVASGTLTPDALQVIQALIQAGVSFLITGGTGTGKTTLLNVISSYIPPDVRIVTVEDTVELDLREGDVTRLEARPANVEGRGEITIRQLVKNSLRMRPQWIVVGEMRQAEALDVLVAGNSGHSVASTVHANSSSNGLDKVATLASMSDEHLARPALLAQVASAFGCVIHLEAWDGKRLVAQISEVSDVDFDTLQVVTTDVFEWRDGQLRQTGHRPERWLRRLSHRGVPLPELWGGG
jgi:pilus assembly protein CpaF